MPGVDVHGVPLVDDFGDDFGFPHFGELVLVFAVLLARKFTVQFAQVLSLDFLAHHLYNTRGRFLPFQGSAYFFKLASNLEHFLPLIKLICSHPLKLMSSIPAEVLICRGPTPFRLQRENCRKANIPAKCRISNLQHRLMASDLHASDGVQCFEKRQSQATRKANISKIINDLHQPPTLLCMIILQATKKVELCLFIRVEAVSFIVFARTFKNNLKNIKGIYIRNTIRNMRGLQDRIQFHPQRPSRSKSRTKFSPYQMHHSNDKHITQARQNRDKLTLKEPIIKIKELISATSHKHKLTLNTEKPYPEPSLLAATNFSNCNFHSPFQTIQNSKFVDLVNKIDQQSNVIEQYFTELNRKLKLPKLEVSEQQKYERQTQKQKETQLLILQQLKSLKNISNQNMHLRQIIARYEKESQYYRQEIQKWQQQAHMLLQKVSNLEKAIIVLQQEKKKNQNSINSIESKCFMKGSKESITKEDEIEVKLAESEKQTKNQLAFIESLQKEIQNLKLQNQMLSEQVKLLNYSLNQREKQFETLKRMNSMAKEPTQKKSLSRKSSIASQIPAVQSKLVNEFDPKPTQSCKLIETSKLIQQDQKEIEAEEMEKNRALQISMRRKSKNTRSLLIKSNGQIDRGLLNSRMSQLVSSGKGCSIDQQILSDKVLKALHIFQSPNMKKSTSQSRYKVNAQIDKRKLNFVKSILKIGAKSNMRETKVAGKREGKEISNFTPAKLADLQIIRKTIGARWRVLRVRFSAIQQQLLDHKSSTITQKQIAQYLEIYPFFLNVQLIEEILRYIFRKDYEQQEESETWPSVELDFFCNCLREFIPEDTPFEQEEEALMLQKIKAVVCQNTLSLLEQLWYEQSEAGVIRQAQMRTVLQQFKFSVPEIQLMIGQCCLISLDIEHLSYEKYISFFNQS